MKINSDFSIISSTCIAGVIYHKLNKRFLSPTINTFICQKDFIKFCKNLNYYLSQDLIFDDENGMDAKLGDITIGFGHYSSKEEAIIKWNERKKRINFDNIFIITSDGNGVTEDELSSLSKLNFKRTLVFTSKKKKIKNSFVLNFLKDQEDASKHMLYNRKSDDSSRLFDEFNYIKWLQMKKNYRFTKSYLILLKWYIRKILKK